MDPKDGMSANTSGTQMTYKECRRCGTELNRWNYHWTCEHSRNSHQWYDPEERVREIQAAIEEEREACIDLMYKFFIPGSRTDDLKRAIRARGKKDE